MQQMKRNGRRPGPKVFHDHETAWHSGNRAFRDNKSELYVIADSGWLNVDHVLCIPKYPAWPVFPIPEDEQVAIRNNPTTETD